MRANNPFSIRDKAQKDIKLCNVTELSEKARSAIKVIYNDCLRQITNEKDVDSLRYLVWGWIIGKEDQPFVGLRSEDLLPAEFNVLGALATEKSNNGRSVRQAFRTEIGMIINLARSAEYYQRSNRLASFSDILTIQTPEEYSAIEINGPSDRAPVNLPDMVQTALELSARMPKQAIEKDSTIKLAEIDF